MKRKVLFLVLAMIVAGGVFAQEGAEGTGYIKPTYGLGFLAVTGGGYTENLVTLSLDVDFVNALGFTLGLQSIMAWNNETPAEAIANFGIGYTHSADKWCIGAKLMAVPFWNGGVGFDLNGTYWLNRHTGITGIMDVYFSVSDIDWSVFSMRIGISTRF